MVYVAIVLNCSRWNARLCKLFTGCYAFHAAFVDLEGGRMYDMNLLRRRRRWPYYGDDQTVEVELYAVPGSVSRQYLEDRLDDDANVYGFVDYLLFGARWLFHLFGRPTRNARGLICSEMVNNDLRACGAWTPWDPMMPPPSPCDLRQWLAASNRPAIVLGRKAAA
jgi:hypothetical protein